MAAADADRNLCRWGRQLFLSHGIDFKYRVDLWALCSPLLAVSRYWGISQRRSNTELRSLNFLGICARCTGSLPDWGCLASSSIRSCRPDRRACRARGYTLDSCKDYQVEIDSVMDALVCHKTTPSPTGKAYAELTTDDKSGTLLQICCIQPCSQRKLRKLPDC